MPAAVARATRGPAQAAAPGKTPALDQVTTKLTQRARDGKVDPVIGRDPEIRQCIDILMRRRQNNPILTGEAGVGKTAVVEGFALRIAQGDVPGPLRNVAVRTLDLGDPGSPVGLAFRKDEAALAARMDAAVDRLEKRGVVKALWEKFLPGAKR